MCTGFYCWGAISRAVKQQASGSGSVSHSDALCPPLLLATSIWAVVHSERCCCVPTCSHQARAAEEARQKAAAAAAASSQQGSGEMDGRMLSALITGELAHCFQHAIRHCVALPPAGKIDWAAALRLQQAACQCARLFALRCRSAACLPVHASAPTRANLPLHCCPHSQACGAPSRMGPLTRWSR